MACYPWCPDFWALSTVVALTHQANATAAAAAAAAASTNKNQFAAAAVAAAAAAAACDPTCSTAESGGLGPDPLPLLAQGVQVLQPLMPFMTAFQLLRAPLMVHGAGLRLKRALLLDPFRTVVPAAAFTMPEQQQMHNMTLMDAHCGSFQQVSSWAQPTPADGQKGKGLEAVACNKAAMPSDVIMSAVLPILQGSTGMLLKGGGVWGIASCSVSPTHAYLHGVDLRLTCCVDFLCAGDAAGLAAPARACLPQPAARDGLL